MEKIREFDLNIEKILENLCPRAIVADRESREHVERLLQTHWMSRYLQEPKTSISTKMIAVGGILKIMDVV